MTLFFSSVWLGLAWFTGINALVSLLVWLFARVTASRFARRSAWQLLALRLGPAAVALAFSALVFLPVHWRFEPTDADESFGLAIRALAALGAFVVGLAGWRAWRAVRQNAALLALLRPSDGSPYVSEHFYGISLAGLVRTRVVVGTAASAALTADELDVAMAHERAHAEARDNLKRFAMFSAPDFLGWTTVGRKLEAAWRAAAEYQADLRAAAGSQTRAADLASALVKVARAAPSPLPSTQPATWSMFHEPSLLEIRVRQLLAPAAQASTDSPSPARTLAVWMLVTLPVLGWAWGEYLHQLTEALVRWMP